MNLADYLSELLGQYDEVSVPGLGCFIRERIKGYYNDKEAKFYPPQHQVKFVPKPKDDDDVFTQYVADKKNISLASSKYFAEKFVAKLREDAFRGKYVFADLGIFVTEYDQLVFKPYDKITGDPAFYGYPQVSIFKASQTSLGTQPPPVFAKSNTPITSAEYDDAPSLPVLTHKPIQQPANFITPPEYFDEEPEPRRRVSFWFILVIIIVAIAGGLFATYKFFPATFARISGAYHSVINHRDSTISVMRHNTADTIKKQNAVKDSAKLKAAADAEMADTVRHSHFAVLEHSYTKYAAAFAAVRFLRAHGVDSAKILTEAPGPLVKVSVGVFKTNDEALAAKAVLVAAGKIKENSQILPIQ